MRTPALHPQRSGFGLAEVALAIAVVTVALMGILGLTSSGLGHYRKVMDTTVAAQLAQRLLNDAEQADFKTLTDARTLSHHPLVAQVERAGGTFSFRAPKIDAPAFRYFDEQGKEIIAQNHGRLTAEQKRAAVYWVNTRIAPRADLPRSDGKRSEVARVTVEVASNPSGLDLGTGAFIETETSSIRWNLLKPSAGVNLVTFSAYIGPKE